MFFLKLELEINLKFKKVGSLGGYPIGLVAQERAFRLLACTLLNKLLYTALFTVPAVLVLLLNTGTLASTTRPAPLTTDEGSRYKIAHLGQPDFCGILPISVVFLQKVRRNR